MATESTGRSLVRVVAPHFVAGLVVDDDHVILAAPILRYMVGWPADKVRAKLAEMGWQASKVSDPG